MDEEHIPMKPVVIALSLLTAGALCVDYARQLAKLPSAIERLPTPPPLPPLKTPAAARTGPEPQKPPPPRREDLKNSRPAPLDDDPKLRRGPPPVQVDESAKPALLSFDTATLSLQAPGAVHAPTLPGKGSLNLLRAEGGIRTDERAEQSADVLPSLPDAQGASPLVQMYACGGTGSFDTRILRTARAWAKVSVELGFRDQPKIDFQTSMIVLLYAGDQLKGQKLVIVSAAEEGGRFLVQYRRAQAGAEEIAFADSQRQPWRPVAVAVVRRSNLPPTYKELP
ncbi:MAG: hypothetical protein HY922_13585 [Elusimicrobia bacterium]|nr:hypothetical protein [Elusimicrobiota bacterium]